MEDISYKIGDRFWNKDTNQEYILASPEWKKVVLISLKTGNRWTQYPVTVRDVHCIDIRNNDLIFSDGNFELIMK